MFNIVAEVLARVIRQEDRITVAKDGLEQNKTNCHYMQTICLSTQKSRGSIEKLFELVGRVSKIARNQSCWYALETKSLKSIF